MADNGLTGARKDGAALLQIMLIVVEVLLSKGIKQATAVVLASDITKEMSNRFGGSGIYFSKGSAIEFAEKAAALYADLDGNNINEVATKYGITTRTAYDVVKRKRQELKQTAKKPDVSTIAGFLKR